MSDKFSAHVKANRAKRPRRRKPTKADDWTERAFATLEALRPGTEINADELLERIGPPPSARSLGGFFQRTAAKGIIDDTGNTVVSTKSESRGRRIRVWRRK